MVTRYGYTEKTVQQYGILRRWRSSPMWPGDSVDMLERKEEDEGEEEEGEEEEEEVGEQYEKEEEFERKQEFKKTVNINITDVSSHNESI